MLWIDHHKAISIVAVLVNIIGLFVMFKHSPMHSAGISDELPYDDADGKNRKLRYGFALVLVGCAIQLLGIVI